MFKKMVKIFTIFAITALAVHVLLNVSANCAYGEVLFVAMWMFVLSVKVVANESTRLKDFIRMYKKAKHTDRRRKKEILREIYEQMVLLHYVRPMTRIVRYRRAMYFEYGEYDPSKKREMTFFVNYVYFKEISEHIIGITYCLVIVGVMIACAFMGDGATIEFRCLVIFMALLFSGMGIQAIYDTKVCVSEHKELIKSLE